MAFEFTVTAILGFIISGFIGLVGVWLLFKGGTLWLRERQPVGAPGWIGSDMIPPPANSGKGQTKTLNSTGPTCHRCKAELRPNAQFCPICGAARVLGERYHILQVIGQGGMGAVYLAEDKRLRSKQWAIKEMSDAGITTQLDRDEAVDAFEREAALLAQLDHPYLPKVIDFFSQSNSHYLVMDYIDGRTLKELLENRPNPFSETKVVEWAGHVCDVLAYLHAQNPPIIFRDLKPANIMLTQKESRIKLIDFGIARLFKPGQKGDTLRLGTPGYAPPEQYSTKGQSASSSDIYALGVTMHQLLTRHDPTNTPFQLPPVKRLNPAVSDSVAQVISHATKTEMTHRYQTAAEMKRALGLG